MSAAKSLAVFLAFLFTGASAIAQSVWIAAKEKGNKFGYIDERGEYVISPMFEEASGFSRGVAIVRKDQKFGLINTKGDFVVPPVYEDAIPYAPEGKVTVRKDGKWGVIDQSGAVVIPFVHEFMSVFVNGFVVAGKYIRKKGSKRMVCPIVLNDRNESVFDVDRFFGKPDGSMSADACTRLFLPGYADEKTNLYSYGWPIVREGTLVLRESDEGGLANSFLLVVDVVSHASFSFTPGVVPSDDYFGVREGILAMDDVNLTSKGNVSQSGFYDVAASMAAKAPVRMAMFEGEKVHPFFNGVAAAEREGKWVFVDKGGRITGWSGLSPQEYLAFPPMQFNGLIAFSKNRKSGFLDLTGREVIPFDLEEFHPFEHDVTTAKKNGLMGLIRKDGSWAVPPRFQELLISPCPCYQ